MMQAIRGWLACGCAVLLATGDAIAFEDSPPAASGVRVPDGFQVTLYADDELASNIYSMTIDSRGRVVVAGPRYVRILHDRDGDGRADSFSTFADRPAGGAQGLFFDGGDGGLRDGDCHDGVVDYICPERGGVAPRY